MSRRAPHRQPRGPRATVPLSPLAPPCGPNPEPELGGAWAAHDRNLCPCWHQYKECPCSLAAHVEPHPAAGCPCTPEVTA